MTWFCALTRSVSVYNLTYVYRALVTKYLLEGNNGAGEVNDIMMSGVAQSRLTEDVNTKTLVEKWTESRAVPSPFPDPFESPANFLLAVFW